MTAQLPRELTADEWIIHDDGSCIRDDNDFLLATVHSMRDRSAHAIAAEMAKRWNAHNALVDALKEAQPFIDNAPTDTARLSLDIREALSLAGEIQLDPPGCVSA